MILRHDIEKYREDILRSNLDVGFRAFERCAARVYDKFPCDVKQSESIIILKRKMKTFLFTDIMNL